MNIEQLSEILSDIQIFDRRFFADPIVRDQDLGWHLFVVYEERDIDTGKMEMQKSRKWFIEPDATETDVVNTAFAAVMRSYDHVVQEHFKYKGKRVFSPHVEINERLVMTNHLTAAADHAAAISEWFRVGEVVFHDDEHYRLTSVQSYKANGGHIVWWGTGILEKHPRLFRTIIASDCKPTKLKNTP